MTTGPTPPRPRSRMSTWLLAGCGCLTLGVVIVLAGIFMLRRSDDGAQENTQTAPSTAPAAAAAPRETPPLEIPPLALDPEGSPRAVELSAPVPEEEQARVLSSIDWSAPILQTGTPEDARRYLIAAARADADVKIENAFSNLSALCREDGRLLEKCASMRQDLQRVATARLGSRDPLVASTALHWIGGFARDGSLKPNEWVPLVLQVAKHHPDRDVRRASIGLAPAGPKDDADATGREIHLVALDDPDPVVVRKGFEEIRLRVGRNSFLQHCRTRLTTKVAALRTHEDAGVRAWAALFTGSIHAAAWQRQRTRAEDPPPVLPREERLAAAAAVRPMLSDGDPVVRGAASIALGEMMDVESAPALAALLDDTGSTIYQSRDVETLTLQLSFPRDVRSSAAAALGHFAAFSGNDVCPQLASSGETKGCLEPIRKWYEANRARIPAFV